MKNDTNARVIADFRAHNGRVGGMFEGVPLVLITTAGRRTGRPHTHPVVALRDGARQVIFGSNGGAPRDPQWYLNLLANPQVTMEIGTEDGRVKPFATRAVPLTGDERAHLWDLQCTRDPAFRGYAAATARTIPVVALHPLDLSGDPTRGRLIGEQLVRHHADLRAEIERVRERLEQVLAGTAQPADPDRPDTDPAEQLRRHCLTFCWSLRLHHTREDGAFSAFEREFPHLVPAIERLRAEHALVERALVDFEAILDRAAAPEAGTRATARRLRAEFERVLAGLEEHFAYEEAHLLPALGG
ncbi:MULTISPECIES: nitroreductase/quinone reductase family protein [unclassified Embleya]|uniref:nitroreductase/quinone reductase family protein n=1 Tax=unclassified Embleya TaxID=2699296 RepID=UPI0036A82392